MKKTLKKTYFKILKLIKKDLRINIKCNYKWYGSGYGGFFACPDLLNDNSIVYSFGIGEDISFDKSVLKEFNCSVYGFDPTPKSINWVKNQVLPNRFKFYEYGIDIESRIVKFYLPKNTDYVSGSIIAHSNLDTDKSINVKMKSFQDIINELGHQKIDILKIDIEGAEFNVLESILETKIQIDQILIEFHERFLPNGKLKRKNAINLLHLKGFDLFAVSDTLEELSFIRRNNLK